MKVKGISHVSTRIDSWRDGWILRLRPVLHLKRLAQCQGIVKYLTKLVPLRGRNEVSMEKWNKAIQNLQDIVEWKANLSRVWDMYALSTEPDQIAMYVKAIELCYRKLDALGALGVPGE